MIVVRMKNEDVKVLNGIMKKLCKTTDPIPRWEFASRSRTISGFVEDLDAASGPSDGIKEYNKRKQELFQKLGSRVSTQDGGYAYRVDDPDAFSDAMSDLNDEFKDVIDEEEDKRFVISDLMNREVEFEFGQIEHKWCGSLIDGDDMAFLMKYDLVLSPTDAELGKGNASKNAKKRKNKSSK